jgi:hypothetical protein
MKSPEVAILAQELDEYEFSHDIEMDVKVSRDNDKLIIDHLYAPGHGEQVINHVTSSIEEFNNNHEKIISSVHVRIGTEHPDGPDRVEEFFSEMGFIILSGASGSGDIVAEYVFWPF